MDTCVIPCTSGGVHILHRRAHVKERETCHKCTFCVDDCSDSDCRLTGEMSESAMAPGNNLLM